MLQAMREGVGRWVAVGLLALLSVAFVFFGIDFSMTGLTFAAKVNGENVPILDFEREVQAQQSQYQQVYRIELTDDLRREIRRNVAETMVRNLALEQRVEEAGYRASDARVLAAIRSNPAFQAGGQFFTDLYRGQLSTAGLTPTMYEEQERLRLSLSDLQDGILRSTFLTPAEFRRYIALTNQSREIVYAEFRLDSFADGIEITDEQIQQRYETNAQAYMTPESVDIEYVELLQADIAASMTVTEQDVRDYYDQERGLFETEEVRRAHHILINIGDGGVDAANARAEEILARLNAGEDFEAVATEVSDDAGTRAQGGDLGAITRGMLAGAFEDALYSMSVGEVRGPVQSDFGVHIIRLDAVDAGDVQSFESVRDELIDQLSNQRAEDRFYELANELDERAYDGEDLAELAADLGLPLIALAEFPRSGDPEVFENSAAVVQQAFSDDILGGLNSRAIELTPDHVLVLRVTAHNEPAQKPLDEVRDQIRDELTTEQAAIQAGDAAAQFLADVATAEDPAALAQAAGAVWHEQESVRRDSPGFPTELLSRLFRLEKPTDSDVVWDNIAAASGDYYVVGLSSIAPGQPETIAREERDQRQDQLADQAGFVDLAGYVGEVRAEATVRIPEEVLEPVF